MRNISIKKIFLTVTVLFFIFQFSRWPITDWLLDRYGIISVGTIINERGYNGKNGHMRTDNIVYCYSFSVDNKEYIGDSQSSNYKIGDTIKVIFIKEYPFINRPYYYLR